MPGALNDILPDAIGADNEAVLMDLLKRKMTVCLDLTVDLLHALEEHFGPEVREVVRELAKNQVFTPREVVGEPQEDLHKFCDMVDRMAAGSHCWKRVIDDPDRIGYQFTRCMYAEILRELGEPDLGLVICSRDGPWVKSYNPKLGFHRMKTLMEGEAFCDHVFYVEK